jgi:hypothetical protein
VRCALLGLLLSTIALGRAQAQEKAPASAAADAQELQAAEEVLDASEEDQRPKPSSSAHVFELRWTTLVTAAGGEPETSLTLDDQGFRTEELLRPREARLYPSTVVAAYAEIAAFDWLLFRGLFDTREVRDGALLEPPIDGIAMNGNPVEDELGSGAVVRELSAVIGIDAFNVEIGRFQSDVADGLVYRDYGSGLRIRSNLDAMNAGPFSAELLLTSVGQHVDDLRANQLLSLRFDWNISPFEYISAFIAGSDDDNGEVSEVLRSAYAENLLLDQRSLTALFIQEEGGGKHGYIGATTQLLGVDGLTIKARLVFSGGKLSLRVPPEQILVPEDVLEGETLELEVSGLATDLELHLGLASWLDLAGYAFLLSGDAPPTRDGQRYESFIALAPYWTWSGLFFSGGLNSGLYPNRASAAGINGRGVVGLGPGIEVTGETTSAELRTLILAATSDPPAAPLGGRNRLYGVELDLILEWQPARWIAFGAELDLLIPGGFFAAHDLAYLALTRVTVAHGS